MQPRLRPIHFQRVSHQGETYFLLDDPFQLVKQQAYLPYPLARMVSQCDGTRTIAQLHDILCAETAAPVPISAVTQTLQQLDELCLLEGDRATAALLQKRTTYRQQPYRPPALAGKSYPADPAALHRHLEAFSTDDTELATWRPWMGRGLVSPHIDYQRGGRVYARVWQRARQAIEAADLILIFATDHKGGPSSLTLSSLPYATPYGILPTDETVVHALENAIGTEAAYAQELNHEQEHAVELVATWLHHIRRDPCPVVPLLIGSFYHLTPDGHPDNDPTIVRFLDALKTATAGRNVFSVASIDLAHIGPAFDTPYVVDQPRRTQLAHTDAQLRAAIKNGDAESWYQQLASTRNANNVCGFAPMYLMLRYLEETAGITVAYEQCSADAAATSTVSICGMLLS